MAEIRTVTTLRCMRNEVRKAIRKYERCLDQARADLTHLIAAIAIFEVKGGDNSLPAYSRPAQALSLWRGVQVLLAGSTVRS
jgi:hypothetical protein